VTEPAIPFPVETDEPAVLPAKGRERSPHFNPRRRGGEATSGKPTPVAPEWMRKPLKPLGKR
jgi:hypothetical protein